MISRDTYAKIPRFRMVNPVPKVPMDLQAPKARAIIALRQEHLQVFEIMTSICTVCSLFLHLRGNLLKGL